MSLWRRLHKWIYGWTINFREAAAAFITAIIEKGLETTTNKHLHLQTYNSKNSLPSSKQSQLKYLDITY